MSEGRCLCRATTFTTRGKPRFVAHCHCESCRRQTGSIPASFVGFPADQVTVLGPITEYESSPTIFRGFCATCGSAIYYRPQSDNEVHLYLGVFDDPAQYRATRHVFYEEQIVGYDLLDNLPRYHGTRSDPLGWGVLPTRDVEFSGDRAAAWAAAKYLNKMSTAGIRGFAAAPPEPLPEWLVEFCRSVDLATETEITRTERALWRVQVQWTSPPQETPGETWIVPDPHADPIGFSHALRQKTLDFLHQHADIESD